jgi:hypothetical protein
MSLAARTFLLASLFAATQAYGQDEKSSVLVGIATAKCPDMAELLELDPQDSTRLFQGWLDGFLSGYNMALELDAGGTSVNLRTEQFPDSSVLLAWLVSSCKAKPDVPLWAHATNLMTLIRSGQ